MTKGAKAPVTPDDSPQTVGTLFRSSVMYAAGSFAYKGIALVTAPVLARLLAPSQLGLLDLAVVFANSVMVVAGLGLDQAAARVQPLLKDDRRVWASVLAMSGLAIAVTVVASIVASASLSRLLTGSSQRSDVLVAASVYGGGMAVSMIGLNTVRLRGAASRYSMVAFAIVSAEAAVAILLAALAPQPVVPIVFVWAGIGVASGSGLLAWLGPRIIWPDRQTIGRLLRFGLPLVPAALAWICGDLAIRATLARESDLAALGQYGIAARIASLLSIGIVGFTLAWHPFLYRASPASAASAARGAAHQLTLLLVLGAIVISLFAHEVVGVLAGAPYRPAAVGVAPLSAAAVAFGLFSLLSAVAGRENRTVAVGLASLAGAGVQILGALLLAGAGIVGAAVASLLGTLIAAVGLLLYLRLLLKVWPVSPWLLAAALPVLVAAAVGQALPTMVRLAIALAFGSALLLAMRNTLKT
jgi:O-antigen/teichoic acid export membrane protein